MLKTGAKVFILAFLVLLLDQWLKFYIKLHFCIGQDQPLLGLDWARLHFVENEGMAFGVTLDWRYGKLMLSVLRLLMIGGLVYYIRTLLRQNAAVGFIYSLGLVTAGAIGNMIDSALYGLIFTASPQVACVLAEQVPVTSGLGYGSFMYGKVVDMFYFPLYEFRAPDWAPFVGGQDVQFFTHIFNLADAAITCGVLSIVVFQRYFFQPE